MNSDDWAEPLPESCPPEDAVSPNGETFFRLTRTLPPTLPDFDSSYAENPARPFRCPDCIAKSTTVWSSLQAALKRRTFPALSDRKIVSITLPDDSGLILKTFADPDHYSWWRRAAFNPLPNCQHINA